MVVNVNKKSFMKGGGKGESGGWSGEWRYQKRGENGEGGEGEF